jgi:plastocyanin
VYVFSKSSKSSNKKMLFGLTIVLFVAIAAAQHTVQVGQNGLSYDPSSLSINTGETVTFHFNGAHSVTQENNLGDCIAPQTPLFDSGIKAAGDDFTFTFSQPGTYHYFCEVDSHCKQGMEGTIIVSNASSSSSAASTQSQIISTTSNTLATTTTTTTTTTSSSSSSSIQPSPTMTQTAPPTSNAIGKSVGFTFIILSLAMFVM